MKYHILFNITLFSLGWFLFAHLMPFLFVDEQIIVGLGDLSLWGSNGYNGCGGGMMWDTNRKL